MQSTGAPDVGAEAQTPKRWLPYVWSALICTAVTLLTAPLHALLDLANIVMVFLLAVVLVAVRYGRGPAVMAAFLSVGAFDFINVPPRVTFSVNDAQYLLMFAVMLIVALVIGQMTAGLKFQARVANLREERARALYEMSRDLSGALLMEQIAEIAARFLRTEFEASSAMLVEDLQGKMTTVLRAPDVSPGVDVGMAQWAFDHSEAVGHGTNTLPATGILYLPLKAPTRTRGVLAIEPRNPARLDGPEQWRVLDTCASLLAISLERIHYVDVAQSTTVQVESERLRNSLLAAIAHDLRTPLSALVGMADALAMAQAPPDSKHSELARSMRSAALRMSSQVNNLLDMARLQAGQVRLNLQWLPLEEAIGSALRALEGTLNPRRVSALLPSDLPLLRIDPALFERVLCNLLENAGKYAPADTPIEIHATATSNRIRVMVDDHGPGLPIGREEAIFQMFERGRKEGATPGVGLGLAICRAIIEAHGGFIVGEARSGGGARFTMDLPREQPPQMYVIEGEIEGGPK